MAGYELFHRLTAIRGFAHLQPDLFERRAHKRPDRWIVIDHEYDGRFVNFLHESPIDARPIRDRRSAHTEWHPSPSSFRWLCVRLPHG